MKSPLLIAVLTVLFLSNTYLIYLQLTHRKDFVYVDSAKLINNYKGMVDARKAYQIKASTWKANIDTLASEVQSQIVKYEKESRAMTAKERELSQELIRAKQKQLSEYQQAIGTQAQQADDTMTKKVLEQVNLYLKKYGKSNGYAIVFAATEYGNIAYAEDFLDVTDTVLEGLNKEYTGQ
jgi:outer membrane protein